MNYAPGARLLIRDEEWVVRSIEPCDVGGHQLSCIGISETVRHRDAIFLTEIDAVTVLDPRDTELVADASPRYMMSLLYLEARLRQLVPTDQAIALGHRGAMDTLPFQLEPTRRILAQLRPRFLIADAVGLGKTLEAGIAVSELMRRGRGRRILVVTTKSMMQQFQKEFWTRFSIPLTRLDSAGIQRIRRELPANHNPFHYYDKTIISVDTLKRDSEYRHNLETANWDVIVIDEAHNVSFKGSRTQSNKLASLLSSRSDALLLLTATPHSGDKESFASLMRMLDPTVLPRKSEYTKVDIQHLFARRFKRDVRDEIRTEFPERKVFRFHATPSTAEEKAFDALADLDLGIDRGKRNGAEMLFRTTLEKALLSSPAACADTTRERIKRLRAKDAVHTDIPKLERLLSVLESISPDEVSKLLDLVARLQSSGEWNWNPRDSSDRLVLFTERIETLNFLQQHLPQRLGLAANAVAVLHGQLPDTEMQEIVESFGKTNTPLRLLIASDVASEGLNLHFQSHRLVHFDIPWSLMVFQQRNGRIDRYGQSSAPLIAYMTCETANPKIRGDIRVLELLVDKDEQAAKNIGDPSIFLGLYDEEKETLRVARAIESGETVAQFAATMVAADAPLDWLDALMTGAVAAPAAAAIASQASFFQSDYHYAKQGLELLALQGQLPSSPGADDAHRTLIVQPDEDLSRLLKAQLELEMRPDDGRYALSGNPAAVQAAITNARETDRWPTVQFLWPLHPVMQWLDFKLLANFGRQRAPVIQGLRGVEKDEVCVLIAGLIPNRRGQPMLNEWLGVSVSLTGEVRRVHSFTELLQVTRLGKDDIPNAGKPVDRKALQRCLTPALATAAQRMTTAQEKFAAEMQKRSREELQQLDALRGQHDQQLGFDFPATEDATARMRQKLREQRTQELDKLFTEYKSWVTQTLELDSRAHLTVMAVLTS